MYKVVLVCGAGGFIGSHLVTKLKQEGNYIIGVDLKKPEFSLSKADEFIQLDLRDLKSVEYLFKTFEFDEIYQLAADMGGAGYIFTGEHDFDIMHNSSQINLNIISCAIKTKKKPKIFYSSSACIYPKENQLDPLNPNCSEKSAYPANPDSEYGWEKLFSERMYLAASRNYNLDVRIARFHNIFGPEGTWRGGKEKFPAAICRKVLTCKDSIDVWGSGNQTRSFLFIDECLTGIEKLMQSEVKEVINIGSEEMISINNLAKMVINFSGRDIKIVNVPGPEGVQGRNSDNKLIKKLLNWAPSKPLEEGMRKTYDWIKSQI
jgi:nucleoside-diphosphate-sugar epimerase